MNQEFRIPSEGEPAAGEELEITSRALRPFGLCKGEFIVPDDFNDSHPDNMLCDFEVNPTNPAGDISTSKENEMPNLDL